MSRYSDKGVLDIEAIRGKKEIVILEGWTKDGEDWVLTDESVRMDIKPAIDINRYAEVRLTKGAGLEVIGNSITITLGIGDTAMLQSSEYYWDLIIGDTPILGGKLILSGRVTR